MPLVVPVLRFFLVFLNVYETFKTLKPPPPSARRGGKPSARAISQRKRDLKGCLAVWVVWCCFAAYERTFDQVVGIIFPFYSEIKSVFLLFLLLTRAKGAEPLFLHVLRPLVKPYTAVVDPMLEISCDIGDFLFALLQVPLDYFLSSSWFRLWRTGLDPEEDTGKSASAIRVSIPDSGSSTRTASHSSIPVLAADYGGAVQNFRVQSDYGFVRGVSDNDCAPTLNPADSRLPAYSEDPSLAPPQYSRTLSGHNEHQIWYPPASAYVASGQEVPVDLPGIAPEYHSPEWRSYPAFPSAYPPTPLPVSAPLPSLATTRTENSHFRISPPSAYPPIPEDEQDFGKTLERQHEGYAGSMRGFSNGNKIRTVVNIHDESSDATQQPDEDTLIDDSMYSSETGLSEDDFGASLRTPHRLREAMLSSASSSVDNLTSTLPTADNIYPLRRSSSDSLSSGSSSLAGRKRTHGGFQGGIQSTLPIAHSRNATLRGRPALAPVPQDPLQSSTSEDEDESEVGDYGNVKAKRQRVLEPFKRSSTVRPAAKEMGNAYKAPLPPRSATARGRVVTTASQGTVRTRGGSITTNNSTIRGRKPTLAPRGGPQSVVKSSSTSSSQSGTLKRRVY